MKLKKKSYRSVGEGMLKKIIILTLTLATLNCSTVNVEKSRGYGVMEVSTNKVYSASFFEKEISIEEVLSIVSKYKKNGEYSKAIRFIEENKNNVENDAELMEEIENLKILVKERLREYSKEEVAKNDDLKMYYNNITSEKINTLSIKSNTPYLLFISIEDQKIYVYKNNNNNWEMEKEFKCASGEEGTETPIGIFKTGARGTWFHSAKFNKGAKYYTQFDGEFLIHSVPYYTDRFRVWEKNLDRPMSHGCVRTDTEDAKWIYENIPYGTKVIIY